MDRRTSIYERELCGDGATPPVTPRSDTEIQGALEAYEDDYGCHDSDDDSDDDDDSFSDSSSGSDDDEDDVRGAGTSSQLEIPRAGDQALASRRPNRSCQKRRAVRAASTLKGAILALDTRTRHLSLSLSRPCVVRVCACACGVSDVHTRCAQSTTLTCRALLGMLSEPGLDYTKWSQLMLSASDISKSPTNYHESFVLIRNPPMMAGEGLVEKTTTTTTNADVCTSSSSAAVLDLPVPCLLKSRRASPDVGQSASTAADRAPSVPQRRTDIHPCPDRCVPASYAPSVSLV
jgi:hypothetical protein